MNHTVESEERVFTGGSCVTCVDAGSWRSKQGIGEPWYNLLLDELPAPVLAWNVQGDIAFWNRKCHEITGFAGTEMVCNSCARETLWPNPVYREIVSRCWSGSRDFACAVTCRNGQVRHIQWHLMSARFPVRGWSTWGIGSDVTDLIALEEIPPQHGRTEAVPEVVPDRVVATGPDGCIEQSDRQLKEELRDTVERAYGKATAGPVTLSNDMVCRFGRERQRKLAPEGTPANIETTAWRPDGRFFPIPLNCRLLQDDSGQPVAIAHSTPDIALLGRLYEATAEKERVLQAFFHAIPESLLLVDAAGKVLACNETAARRVGRTVQTLVGSPAVECLADVASSDGREQHMARIAEVFRSREPVYFTDIRGGLVLEYTLYPVVDDRNRATSVAIVVRDMTEQVRTRRELREYCQQLRGAKQLASLGTVAATLTDELTEPLTIVELGAQTALVELEELNCADGSVRQNLEASVAASAAMAATVSRFRDLARLSAKVTEVHVDRVAEWAIRLLEESARQVKVSFRTENLRALPAIRMRENELEHVFFALAQNVVRTADGTRDRCLLITGALHGSEIELRFEDDCGGIEPRNLPAVADPFLPTRPPIDLEMSVARQIVHRRGGQISVQNRCGQGVTSVVTLPVNPEFPGVLARR